MLLATQLKRSFVFTDKSNPVVLTDPNPEWSPQAVLNFYANTYPILTTAKIAQPTINNDSMEYKFESVMGTKG